MKVQHIEAEASSAASPDALWSLLGDRSTWPAWSPLGSHSAERPGHDGEPDGVGAVAEFVTGRNRVREEIVELERPRLLSYVLVSGLPLQDYRALVELTPSGSGTHIRWSATFAPKRPGTGLLYRLVLGRFFRGMVNGLAAAAQLPDDAARDR